MKKSDKSIWSLRSLTMFALQDWGSDTSWDAVYALQGRGAPDTLALARRLARSRNWRKRALGLYIASQLYRRGKFSKFSADEYAIAETQALLLPGLDDPRREVVLAAVSGMGHRPSPAALPRLLALAGDADGETRWHVTVALCSYMEDDATQMLMTLARDPDEVVRDWATFGIGTQRKTDNAAIRELLWTNLHDEDECVRGEALAGLAERKDERIIDVLLNSFDDNCSVYELKAAELMAHRSLLDKLEVLEGATRNREDIGRYWYDNLVRAIEACRRS